MYWIYKQDRRRDGSLFDNKTVLVSRNTCDEAEQYITDMQKQYIAMGMITPVYTIFYGTELIKTIN